MLAALMLFLAQEAPEIDRLAPLRPLRGTGLSDRISGFREIPCHAGLFSFVLLDREARERVTLALRWLARNQAPDGSWDVPSEPHRLESTALAVLAFLASGHTHRCICTWDGVRFSDVVRRGLTWIMGRQGVDGWIGEDSRDHALAFLALSEAYGWTVFPLFLSPLERALPHLLRTDDDWALLALRSAHSWSLKAPPAPTAAGRLILRTERDWDALLPMLEVLRTRPPDWRPGEMDFEQWHSGTLHLYLCDGPRGFRWSPWWDALRRTLYARQAPKGSGPDAGSWDPADSWSSARGRAAATALNALTLQTPVRFPFILASR